MKKLLSFILALVLTFVSLPASAEYVNRQTGPSDYDSYYLPGWWDIEEIEVYDDSDNLNRFVTAVRFASWPLQSQFWITGYMLVSLDTNGDLEDDYILSTPDAMYPYDYGEMPFQVFDVARSQFVSGCDGTTWMADGYDPDDDYVVFEFNKSCLPFGSTVNISAGINSETGYFDFYDWATFNTGVASKPRVTLGKPSAPTQPVFATASPSSNPTDLSGLSARVLQSVVQIKCASGAGSGWVAQATLSSQMVANGYKSVVITNNHVIEDCSWAGSVEVILNNGTSVTGEIFATDVENDLAGVAIKTSVPGLVWQGSVPAQGWWVGVLGSPLSLSGYLSTGIISRTGAFGDYFATTAALNPGNSGGPVFDRSGRVVGTATAKATGSEGIGLWVTAPDLCQAIVSCPAGTSQIWQSNLSAPPSETSGDQGSSAGSTQPSGDSPKLSSKNFSFPKFVGSSFSLSSAQKAKIADVISQIPNSQKFVCTSVITDSTSRTNAVLYRKRAKAMCEYAKSLNPNLSTWFQSKKSEKRAAEGMLLITVKY